ncbi:MAG TPA: DUF3822 family protein [Ferruginibacter sp.]|nr:DUF3822 family protein [Ferruginibacter sp.]
MDPKFNIQLSGTDTSGNSLFVQLSYAAVSFIAIGEGNKINALVSYDFPPGINELTLVSFLKDIFAKDTLLQNDFKKVDVVVAFAMSLLIPYHYHNNTANKAMFELVYGDRQDNVLKNDLKFNHDLCNIYEVPRLVNSILSMKFPLATITHQYSVLPDIIKAGGNHLYTIFGDHDITAMLLKEGKLQIVQNFKYKTPEDVAYYLLGICQSFTITVNDVVLHVNGILEKESNLFKEIDGYFPQIEFAGLPETFDYSTAIKEYPAHFFSHLFATVSCV